MSVWFPSFHSLMVSASTTASRASTLTPRSRVGLYRMADRSHCHHHHHRSCSPHIQRIHLAAPEDASSWCTTSGDAATLHELVRGRSRSAHAPAIHRERDASVASEDAADLPPEGSFWRCRRVGIQDTGTTCPSTSASDDYARALRSGQRRRQGCWAPTRPRGRDTHSRAFRHP